MQLVTWNDYEEGTEIESGIDNCVSVSAAMAGSSLQWKITGSENTIDHYRVYVSSDGQNLMPLADQTVGTYALDLCGYSLAAGNYKLFVQAIGKPNLKNQISAPIAYAAQCGATSSSSAGPPEGTATTPPVTSTPPPASASVISLSASPSSVTIVNGQSGSPRITVTARSKSAGPIALSCSGLPAAMSCAFSPSVITPGSKPRRRFSESRLSARHIVRSLCPGRLAGVPWWVSGWEWLECLCLARLTGNGFSAAWLSAA